MNPEALRLLVQMGQAEQSAGRAIPECIAVQLLAYAASSLTSDGAERARRYRDKKRDAVTQNVTNVTQNVTNRVTKRDAAAVLGGGVGGVGAVAVAFAVSSTNQNSTNNSAEQEQPLLHRGHASTRADEFPSLDELDRIPRTTGLFDVTPIRSVPPSVEIAQQSMLGRMAGVHRGNLRRQRNEAMAHMVFGYYVATHGKPRAKMGPETGPRFRLLVKALEQNEGDMSELFHALDGARKDSWTLSTHNDTVDWILRNRANIEKYASLSKQGDRPHPQATEFLAALHDTQPQLAGVA